MSKNFDPGKWAENEVEKVLKERSAASAYFAYHRYPDAKSAQGALSAQPADFEVTQATGVRRGAMNLEVKETKQEHRLPKTKIRQYGKLKMFDLAGKPAFVVVYRSTLNDWVVLNSEHLFGYEDCPPSFPLKDLRPFATAEGALNHILGPITH